MLENKQRVVKPHIELGMVALQKHMPKPYCEWHASALARLGACLVFPKEVKNNLFLCNEMPMIWYLSLHCLK